uniref:Nucleolysin TIA-1/TIAR n=1 Tax=Syphacia muris TaxID=451379 RepID=A0A0N5AN77_9BILA
LFFKQPQSSWQYKTLSAGASALETSASDIYASGSRNYDHYYCNAQNAGFDVGNETRGSRTICVTNLDPSVVDSFLAVFFGEVGEVTRTQINFKDYALPHAFVEFVDSSSAAEAAQKLNGAKILDQEIATKVLGKSSDKDRSESAQHFQVFVGDLTYDVDNQVLRDAFSQFGNISDAKVIIDPTTQRPKGYGFVSYPTKEEAERAIEQMNGAWLGHRQIRTNWANRRLEPAEVHHKRRELSYADVYNKAGADNCSVYVGNVESSVSEEELRRLFEQFGKLMEVRLCKSKSCAFLRYEKKEYACSAITEMNNKELNGRIIRCSWGKF